MKNCHKIPSILSHLSNSGKPHQTIPAIPLQPIVVPSEPFDKVVLDCVGPLPKTKKGMNT